MDGVVNSWDAILSKCFPDCAATPGGPCYATCLKRHPGAWQDGWGRSLSVEQITFDPEPQLPGMPPKCDEVDIAWVECAAPNRGKEAAGWRDLMGQAVHLLGVMHPAERILLILAMGFKWMPFWWDPVTVEPRGSGMGSCSLLMQGDGEGETWPVDSRVSLILPGEVDGESRKHTDGPPASALTVKPLHEAYNLDFWTLDEARSVANLEILLWLEKLLIATQLNSMPGSKEAETEDSTGKE